MAKKRWCLCLVCVFCLVFSVMAKEEAAMGVDTPNQAVTINAFDLRMAGKLDEAKVILEQSTSHDPSNAMVQYELARVYYHMALGNPQEMEGMFKESQVCIERAIDMAPENVIYHTFAGHVAFMRGYICMYAKGDNPAAKEQFENACKAFKSTIRFKPDDKVAMLYLVELYGDLPNDVGGNKAMAGKYAKQLEDVDVVFAAKADSILSSKDAAYWKEVLKAHPNNAEVLEELGKAYLKTAEVDEAVSCFEEAVKQNPKKAYLFLDLSIFHTYSAMSDTQDKALFGKNVTAGDAAVSRYLNAKPILPMRAYALGVQSKYKSFSGDKDLGQALYKKAKTLDPYFSKATGCPLSDLFISPEEISKNHRYLMRPF